MSKELRRALDLEPEEERVPMRVPTEQEQDFEFVRQNLMDLVGKSQEALEDMIDIARKSQHPAAYDVLNSMFKNAARISRDVLEIRKTRREAESPTEQTPTQHNTQNNVYVGSTTDLLKMLSDKRDDPDT